TATSPSPVSCSTTHPSSRGATSSAGPAKNLRGSTAPAAGPVSGAPDTRSPPVSPPPRRRARRPSHAARQAARRPVPAPSHGPTVRLPCRQGAPYRQHLPDVRREMGRDLGQVLVAHVRQVALVHLAPHDQVPDHLVRLAEGDAAPDEEFGQVGGEREPGARAG